MSNYVKKHLGNEEEIVGIGKVHRIILLPHILLCFVLVGFITIWIPIIRLCTTDLAFTNKRLTGKIGLINIKSLDTPLNKINNISITQGLGGLIFGYGTLVISSSSAKYKFKGIKNPEEFKNKLIEEINKFDEDKMKQQAIEIARAMKVMNDGISI